MQVWLAIDDFHDNWVFRRFCTVFTLGSILFTVILVGIMMILWILLFCYHLNFTVLYFRQAKRGQTVQQP
jgi:uncharacterized membrane protein